VSSYIGVDPGAQGYLCLLDTTFNNITYMLNPSESHDDVYQFQLTLRQIVSEHHIMGIAIEDVHSIHRMSAKSNFTFGRNVERVNAILQCTFRDVDIEKVTPKVWQKAVGAPSRKFLNDRMKLKQAIADIAEAIYPHADLYGPKGGLKDGKADALMIAHYLYMRDRSSNECFTTKTTET